MDCKTYNNTCCNAHTHRTPWSLHIERFSALHSGSDSASRSCCCSTQIPPPPPSCAHLVGQVLCAQAQPVRSARRCNAHLAAAKAHMCMTQLRSQEAVHPAECADNCPCIADRQLVDNQQWVYLPAAKKAWVAPPNMHQAHSMPAAQKYHSQ